MAQQIQVRLIDDLDGSDAEGTVHFGLDGRNYEIDLSTAHAEALRESVQKYVLAGRRVTLARRPSSAHGRQATSDGPGPTQVRDWAKSQGIEVKDRGRVPADLVVKFQAATDV